MLNGVNRSNTLQTKLPPVVGRMERRNEMKWGRNCGQIWAGMDKSMELDTFINRQLMLLLIKSGRMSVSVFLMISQERKVNLDRSKKVATYKDFGPTMLGLHSIELSAFTLIFSYSNFITVYATIPEQLFTEREASSALRAAISLLVIPART